MKLAIMQPYFFPYLGYFQLMSHVDEFVVYDTIEFSKKGWINRNRILVHGKDSYITVPLKKDSDYLDIGDRRLAENWPDERRKILNKIIEAYRKAPYFRDIYPLIERSILFEENNLFKFIFYSLILVKEYLEIRTPVVIASTFPFERELKAEKKVISICQARKANVYINPIGGVELYNKQDFKDEGIDLVFLKMNDFKYKQFNNNFINSLSIIDVMMFNSKAQIKEYLNSYFTLS